MIKFILPILLLMMLNINSDVIAEQLPELCNQDCEVTYGEVLGRSEKGIEAYSNCSSRCINPSPFFVDKTFTGIKWQCVEYARRWLLINHGLVYSDVDVAADIWQLDTVTSPDKQIQKPFIGILNGDSESYVQRGDLLIYSRAFLGTGHVAVVVEVDTDNQRVYLAEQNFDNNRWAGQSARDIPYIFHADGMWLLDPYLIGWKRVVIE